MKALVLLCTLKKSPAPSNTEALTKVVLAEMAKSGVTAEIVRLADKSIPPGVKSDEGEGDEWPEIRAKIVAADILIVATPIWLGQHSSLCQRAMERLDAFFGETDDNGHTPAMGKVGGVVITGNEDGAHHIVGTVGQCLIDLGFTVPAQSWTYWHLGPGAGPDYLDDPKGHDYSDRVGRNAARTLVHAAKALKAAGPFPKLEGAD